VTQAAVAADVHQTLDVRRYLRAQNALGFVLRSDDGTDGARLLVGPVLYLLVQVDTGLRQDFLGVAPANAENVSQGDFAALVVRDINPCDTSHFVWLCVCGQNPGNYLEGEQQTEPALHYPRLRDSKIGLALTLLEAGVFLVDDVELAITADQFAVHATLFHRGFYFHGNEGLGNLGT